MPPLNRDRNLPFNLKLKAPGPGYSQEEMAQAFRQIEQHSHYEKIGTIPAGCPLFCGKGSPEGKVSSPVGGIYEQTDIDGTSYHPLWVKVLPDMPRSILQDGGLENGGGEWQLAFRYNGVLVEGTGVITNAHATLDTQSTAVVSAGSNALRVRMDAPVIDGDKASAWIDLDPVLYLLRVATTYRLAFDIRIDVGRATVGFDGDFGESGSTQWVSPPSWTGDSSFHRVSFDLFTTPNPIGTYFPQLWVQKYGNTLATNALATDFSVDNLSLYPSSLGELSYADALLPDDTSGWSAEDGTTPPGSTVAMRLGQLAYALGQEAVALGPSNDARGYRAVSVGTRNRTTGDVSHAAVAMGVLNQATNAVALGDSNVVTTGVALGKANVISGTAALAVGESNTATNRANAILIGNGNSVSVDDAGVIGHGTALDMRGVIAVGGFTADVNTQQTLQINGGLSIPVTEYFWNTLQLSMLSGQVSIGFGGTDPSTTTTLVLPPNGAITTTNDADPRKRGTLNGQIITVTKTYTGGSLKIAPYPGDSLLGDVTPFVLLGLFESVTLTYNPTVDSSFIAGVSPHPGTWIVLAHYVP